MGHIDICMNREDALLPDLHTFKQVNISFIIFLNNQTKHLPSKSPRADQQPVIPEFRNMARRGEAGCGRGHFLCTFGDQSSS